MDISNKLVTLNTDLELINDKVSQQSDLISQIQEALANKASCNGDDGAVTKILSGTITSYSNNSIGTLRSNAFRDSLCLTDITFPACTSIGADAFYGCCALYTASFNAVDIGAFAFAECVKLKEILISNPEYTASIHFGRSCFRNCSNLKNIILNIDSANCSTIVDASVDPDAAFYVKEELISDYEEIVDNPVYPLSDIPEDSVFYGFIDTI